MEPVKWEDITHHHPSVPAARRRPLTYCLSWRGIVVYVMRLSHRDPNAWYLTCHDADLKERELPARNLAQAKMDALTLSRKAMAAKLSRFDELIRAVEAELTAQRT